MVVVYKACMRHLTKMLHWILLRFGFDKSSELRSFKGSTNLKPEKLLRRSGMISLYTTFCAVYIEHCSIKAVDSVGNSKTGRLSALFYMAKARKFAGFFRSLRPGHGPEARDAILYRILTVLMRTRIRCLIVRR